MDSKTLEPLTDAELREWSDYLGDVVGWTFGRLRARVLTQALADRMSRHGYTSYHEFLQLVSRSQDGTEVAHLVELIVNRETSFFRNEPVFTALTQRVLPELLASSPAGSTLNFLSAGCSTGQEVYSMAMAVDQAMPAEGSRPVAFWGRDISQPALAYARDGRYTRSEIESLPQAFRGYLCAHLDTQGMRYQVPEEVRSRTTFAWTNLHQSAVGGLTYDAIICQNVLLYFHARAAIKVVHHLCSRLSPGGYLFLGPGEATETLPTGVELVHFPQARALRRAR